MQLEYSPGLKKHSLLILKEIFLNQIYSLTKATDHKLKNLQDKEGGAIVDIGANIGIATAYFKNKYPNIRLIAIEASPINYDLLVRNIKHNAFYNILTLNNFVSSKTKKIRYYHNTKKPGSSFGKGYKSNYPSDLVEFDVETIKIDDVINDLNNIVIKIDVEGAEYEILEDLANSVNISKVLEITAEVSTHNQAHFDSLNMVISKYRYLGFEPRFISDYDVNSLSDKLKQGHLQLILLRV